MVVVYFLISYILELYFIYNEKQIVSKCFISIRLFVIKMYKLHSQKYFHNINVINTTGKTNK